MKKESDFSGLLHLDQDQGTGHLKLDGPNSRLNVVAGVDWHSKKHGNWDLHGTLTNGSHVSLLDCVMLGSTSYGADRGKYEHTIFPHSVVIGKNYLRSDDQIIRKVRYHFGNVDGFIGGYDTFKSIHIDQEEARRILEADHKRHSKIAREQGWEERAFEPEIGESPLVLYYSGKWEIIRCDSSWVSVSLNNHSSHNMGSAAGIGVKNEVAICLDFKSARTLREAVHALYRLHCLFELNLGSRQRYGWIELELEDNEPEHSERRPPRAQLFWSYCNERVQGETNKAHIADVLLNPERRPEEFQRVVSGWLDTESEMEDARDRFSTAFDRSYSIDRLVGAANMFDILPESKAPSKLEPDGATVAAVNTCRTIFKALPDSFARQSVLSSLGRVGTASLRDKVWHRAKVLVERFPEKFSELKSPCSQAVQCRNHYVHGSPAQFDYRKDFHAFAFLTDTLEFVFAASDLVELGWDINEWSAHGFTMSHPFGAYMVNYAGNLNLLKASLRS